MLSGGIYSPKSCIMMMILWRIRINNHWYKLNRTTVAVVIRSSYWTPLKLFFFLEVCVNILNKYFGGIRTTKTSYKKLSYMGMHCIVINSSLWTSLYCIDNVWYWFQIRWISRNVAYLKRGNNPPLPLYIWNLCINKLLIYHQQPPKFYQTKPF